MNHKKARKIPGKMELILMLTIKTGRRYKLISKGFVEVTTRNESSIELSVV